MKRHFLLGPTFSRISFAQFVIIRRSSINLLFTNLKTVDVRVDRVGSCRACVYKVPFLKGIHFNIVSKISRQT